MPWDVPCTMARWIGIDFGKVRTGLAYTDPSCVMAFPHKTVLTADLIAALKQLVNDAPCAGFALGIPNRWGVSTGDGFTDSSAPILAFKKRLEQQFPFLRVVLIDETNTSREALQSAIESGMKKSKRSKKGAVDDVAAALILQRFIDERSH